MPELGANLAGDLAGHRSVWEQRDRGPRRHGGHGGEEEERGQQNTHFLYGVQCLQNLCVPGS